MNKDNKAFKIAKFIEHPDAFDPAYKATDPAPVFQKSFTLTEAATCGTVTVCALGLGYVYLNGRPITEDLFTAPVSDYRKSLWYTVYDVADLLHVGENRLTVIVGNGFYNESLKTGWDFDTADWRGNPKVCLECVIRTEQQEICIASDESWTCSKEASPVRFNQLRSGETYDCRIGETFLTEPKGEWIKAVYSANPPKGVFRRCNCPPVRAFERYAPVRVIKNANGRVVYDFGQNLSGYADITLQGTPGQVVTLRHSERLFADGTLDQNGMDGFPFYQGPEFQTNRIILSGGADRVIPRFTYHGFRYIEMEGASAEQIKEIKSVFVHQAVEAGADLVCSNETINRLISCARTSVWSNMFYTLTDCPTREKLGWTNDAIASAEQICMSFEAQTFFEKWLQDILDAMTPNGEIPSIIPTWGWGLEENTTCIGPLCSGIIFELPMAMYNATGDLAPLRLSYPAMCKNLEWIAKKEDENGFVSYGLGDWAGPFHHKRTPTPLPFVTTAQYLWQMRLALRTAELLGTENSALQEKYERCYHRFIEVYYDERYDKCLVQSQSAVALMINLLGPTEGLKEQLRKTVEKKNYHHNCGMVTLRHLYKALDRCDLNDLAYAIVTADGRPSYKEWLEDGATTLYEMWNTEKSNNHHMNSCVIAWIYQTIAGIRTVEGAPQQVILKPFFPEDMEFCNAHTRAAAVEWNKTNEGTALHWFSSRTYSWQWDWDFFLHPDTSPAVPDPHGVCRKSHLSLHPTPANTDFRSRYGPCTAAPDGAGHCRYH
ncbi:MAG: family 78 glycoside hydrolase catalytic domain, partial [Clostridia bacterium]|nr:family 78 glycoside hydrolase catalytic domain [Clostridia bacterium]